MTVSFFDDVELAKHVTRRERKINNRRKKAQYKTREQYIDVERELNSKTFDLKNVVPITPNQHEVFKAYAEGKNLLLHGVAGTGKTFLALYLSLKSVIRGEAPKPITIIRSIVPSREMGYLPGKIEEKSAIYEAPYYGLCAELTGHKTAYEHMKSHGLIEFSTTSHLRGLTFHNNTIIVDECQNMSGHELDTIITRVGSGCRVIFCGDFRQTDLKFNEERRGLHKFMDVLGDMDSFSIIEFLESDIVRSGLVKEYLLAKLARGIEF